MGLRNQTNCRVVYGSVFISYPFHCFRKRTKFATKDILNYALIRYRQVVRF